MECIVLVKLHCVSIQRNNILADNTVYYVHEWSLLQRNVKCVHKEPMATRHLRDCEMMTHF